ncbi:phosphate ABC transporter ATP-binding protein [Desulfovermiculus halophilus]|jgi:phosphate transport system ATP-binding protein|uniref:phosphate ABC transporter ATP-binding protein n=1 Tax=Desulfovermiculus halophilus TaxID=339722 RepID=UPI000684807F|nr:phosphate ABC transporter ATP-binding protein [Desulfovermiculus halophilus]
MELSNPALFLEAQALTVDFDRQQALDRVDLQAIQGEVTVLLGRSGSGKTTFLRSLNRLNDELGAQTKGSVRLLLDGQLREILASNMDPNWLRRRVGMVFQTPNLLPTSIAKNILTPLKLVSKMDKATREEQMHKVLKQTRLWDEVRDRLKTPALSLSGGQQQRLCLARTLALKPQILLLDEPTASLDFRATRHIEELLLELAETYPMIIVSHSPGQAERLAHAVAVFSQGRVVQELKKGEISCAELKKCIDYS